MLHHISIAAAEPLRVAKVLAELTNGTFFEFPIYPRAYIAIVGDDFGSAIEVMPQNVVMIPGSREFEFKTLDNPSQFNPCHLRLGELPNANLTV